MSSVGASSSVGPFLLIVSGAPDPLRIRIHLELPNKKPSVTPPVRMKRRLALGAVVPGEGSGGVHGDHATPRRRLAGGGVGEVRGRPPPSRDTD